MKITRTRKEARMDKYTNLPYIIETICKVCKAPVIVNLEDNHLEYAIAGKIQKVNVYCEPCNLESYIEFKFDVIVEEVKVKLKETYTIEEIRAYLESQDSLGDIHYNLNNINTILNGNNKDKKL